MINEHEPTFEWESELCSTPPSNYTAPATRQADPAIKIKNCPGGQQKGDIMQILEMLPTGEANAVTSQHLANQCGFDTVRKLQKAIEVLRCAGHVICSTAQNSGGYFFPATTHELRMYVRTVDNRARNTHRSLQSAKKALKEMEAETHT